MTDPFRDNAEFDRLISEIEDKQKPSPSATVVERTALVEGHLEALRQDPRLTVVEQWEIKILLDVVSEKMGLLRLKYLEHEAKHG